MWFQSTGPRRASTGGDHKFQSKRPRGARPCAKFFPHGVIMFQSTRPHAARQTYDTAKNTYTQFQSTRPHVARLSGRKSLISATAPSAVARTIPCTMSKSEGSAMLKPALPTVPQFTQHANLPEFHETLEVRAGRALRWS